MTGLAPVTVTAMPYPSQKPEPEGRGGGQGRGGDGLGAEHHEGAQGRDATHAHLRPPARASDARR